MRILFGLILSQNKNALFYKTGRFISEIFTLFRVSPHFYKAHGRGSVPAARDSPTHGQRGRCPSRVLQLPGEDFEGRDSCGVERTHECARTGTYRIRCLGESGFVLGCHFRFTVSYCANCVNTEHCGGLPESV